MQLKLLKYKEFINQPNEWVIDGLKLKNINLIVGVNAIGKTRMLNVIRNIANRFTDPSKTLFSTGEYELEFDEKNKKYKYFLKILDYKVKLEKLMAGKKTLFTRDFDGKGTIYAEELKRKIVFQISEDKLAIHAKRDKLQHPFLEKFYEWGSGMFFYPFGTDLGKKQLFAKTKDENSINFDIKNPDFVIQKFIDGEHKFGDKFKELIKEDMKKLNYIIKDVYVAPVKNLTFKPSLPIEADKILALNINEGDEEIRISQNEISQGMFRTLSLLIQINYLILANETDNSNCILIDDIGEGLDYDRATALIKLIIDKIENSSIQLVMTTNDRFVMNNTPLKYWSIIEGEGSTRRIISYENSKKVFDDFIFTGLSNFDFFSSKFYLGNKNN